MITIEQIETRPRLDPYHQDTGQPTTTVIKLYPEEKLVYVLQEYDDHATPSDEWHGLVLTWKVFNWPLKEDMRQFLEENMHLLETIADGWQEVWDGSNFVGRLTPDARSASDNLESLLDRGLPEGYSFMLVDNWLYPVYANVDLSGVTVAQLEAWAEAAHEQAEHEQIALSGSCLDWLLERMRDAA